MFPFTITLPEKTQGSKISETVDFSKIDEAGDLLEQVRVTWTLSVSFDVDFGESFLDYTLILPIKNCQNLH